MHGSQLSGVARGPDSPVSVGGDNLRESSFLFRRDRRRLRAQVRFVGRLSPSNSEETQRFNASNRFLPFSKKQPRGAIFRFVFPVEGAGTCLVDVARIFLLFC